MPYNYIHITDVNPTPFFVDNVSCFLFLADIVAYYFILWCFIAATCCIFAGRLVTSYLVFEHGICEVSVATEAGPCKRFT